MRTIGRRNLLFGSAAVWAAWLVTAYVVAPRVIAKVYAGTGIGPLDGVMAGRDRHSLDRYLGSWNDFARFGTAILAGVTLLLLLLIGTRVGARILEAGRRTGSRLRRGLAATPDLATGGAALWLLAGLGLVTGILDMGIRLVPVYRGVFWPTPFPRSLDALWMSSFGWVMTLVALGAGARLIGRAGGVIPRAAVFYLALALPPFAVVREAFPGVHPWAAAALACGVAARAWTPFWSLGSRRARALPAVIGTLVSVLALGTLAKATLDRLGERRATAALPAAATGRHNVILITLDTVRGRDLGWLGYERPTTPWLDRFVDGGVVFERALSSAPWTLPSHGSLFTGRGASELTTDWNRPLDDRFPTLAEWFREQGYRTGGFVANIEYCAAEYGLARGFLRYEDDGPPVPWFLGASWPGRTLLRGWRRVVERTHQEPIRVPGSRITYRFLRWIDAEPGRAFFAFLNYFDAHQPYLPPAEFERRFGRPDGRYWIRRAGERLSGEQIQELRDSYDDTIAYLDSLLEGLVAALDARGLLDETLIVLTSDHGEEFREHGALQHGNTLYAPSLHVPLVFVGPGVPAGRRIAEPAGLADIPATLEEMIGGSPPRVFPGVSLAARWSPASRGESARPPGPSAIVSSVTAREWLPVRYPATAGDLVSVVADGLHYIRGGGSEELYDLMTDPWETRDLSATPRGADALVRMRALLRLRAVRSRRP